METLGGIFDGMTVSIGSWITVEAAIFGGCDGDTVMVEADGAW